MADLIALCIVLGVLVLCLVCIYLWYREPTPIQPTETVTQTHVPNEPKQTDPIHLMNERKENPSRLHDSFLNAVDPIPSSYFLKEIAHPTHFIEPFHNNENYIYVNDEWHKIDLDLVYETLKVKKRPYHVLYDADSIRMQDIQTINGIDHIDEHVYPIVHQYPGNVSRGGNITIKFFGVPFVIPTLRG